MTRDDAPRRLRAAADGGRSEAAEETNRARARQDSGKSEWTARRLVIWSRVRFLTSLLFTKTFASIT
eukprot:9015-Pelagococcus_subviridis.AAC.1